VEESIKQTDYMNRPLGLAHEASAPDLRLVSADWKAGHIAKTELAERSRASAFVKRSLDILGALSIALVGLPVIVAVAIIIRFSGQPVVFSHQRVGKGRELFRCYKFRSMIPDAERVLQELLQSDPKVLREWSESHKIVNDPRVTKFGRFLRNSSLDELPQLWNVLRGDMSLVGPRPIIEDEIERYGGNAKFYLSVKPGITGLWQVMGRSNVTYSRRVSMDVLYVRKQSFRLDAWVLIRTISVVLKRVGAH
jgi:lipopolysaccharide/colanic/teichoic acid biosynthesis glycosyltransferase